jgi:cytochrome c peroxidase
VKDVIQNKDEVHGSLELASKRMMNDPGYTQAFMKAFPGTDSINPAKITIVLASYIRSLAGFRSNFDQYMRGDKTRMDRDAVEGFNLFMGKAKCGTCHFMPMFNGTVPPAFTSTESEVLGVPEHSDGKKLDKDPGRYAVYKIPEFLSAFKTPSVRNVALTAPYMHNGVYKTLEEVMEFYNKGGGRGLGLEVEYQTLPEDPLNLTKDEQRKIISFLGTLTDTSSTK